ncbi:MAG: hypothetical protein RL375_291 [Pseudomonadota bacterium]
MRHLTRSSAAPAGDEPPAWPHRDLLLQRQQELLRRSAELRGELSAEVRAGWHSVEAPIDLLLHLRGLVLGLRQRGRDLRDQHPWVGILSVLWPVLLRRVWRLVWRHKSAATSHADPPGLVRRLLQAVQWARRGIKLWRLFSQAAPSARPPG